MVVDYRQSLYGTRTHYTELLASSYGMYLATYHVLSTSLHTAYCNSSCGVILGAGGGDGESYAVISTGRSFPNKVRPHHIHALAIPPRIGHTLSYLQSYYPLIISHRPIIPHLSPPYLVIPQQSPCQNEKNTKNKKQPAYKHGRNHLPIPLQVVLSHMLIHYTG